MDISLYLLGYAAASTYLLWVFFLAVTALKKAKAAGTLTPITWTLAVPVLAIGFAIDFAVNVTVMTVLFLELPREITVTARLKKYRRRAPSWRQSLANWFVPILNPFDPDHI